MGIGHVPKILGKNSDLVKIDKISKSKWKRLTWFETCGLNLPLP
jgi:hypothetical protein